MIDNFIGIFDNALSSDSCDKIVATYNSLDSNYIANRQMVDSSKKIDKDTELSFLRGWKDTTVNHRNSDEIFDEFNNVVWNKCYKEYAEKYGILSSLANHTFYDDLKIQKTKPTEGYHVWHCEHDSRTTGSRLLLVIAYLNDVEEGGETEFLYQSKRIKPKKGTVIICPSGFTHTHRGNPPLSGDKYILNGWIEYIN